MLVDDLCTFSTLTRQKKKLYTDKMVKDAMFSYCHRSKEEYGNIVMLSCLPKCFGLLKERYLAFRSGLAD